MVCVCMCVYIYPTFSLSIHLLIDTDCFHILAIINNAAVKLQVSISFQINIFEYIHCNGISGLYCSSG